MKVYKFRSTNDLSFALDVLVKNRLFCSNVESHGDLAKCLIDSDDLQNALPGRKAFMQEVQTELKRIRICSLVGSFKNSLLWSRYAGGYDGVVFEMDVPDEDLWKVDYEDCLVLQYDLMGELSPQEFTRVALSKKSNIWANEDEYLIICPFEFYRLSDLISRVIVGPNVGDAVAGAFCLIGKQIGVPVERLGSAGDSKFLTFPVKAHTRLGYHGISTVT